MVYKGKYPLLNIPEITNALAGWNISVSQEQLHAPSPEFVESMYLACLRRVTNISDEILADPLQDALSASSTEDKELYNAALSSNLLNIHLMRLAAAARVDVFSVKDLSHPERNRTLSILSGFINFIKFIEHDCDDFVRELRSRSDAILDERTRIGDQLEASYQRAQELKFKQTRDEPLIEQLKIENGALGIQLRSRKDLHEKLKEDLKDIRAQKRDLMTRQEQLSVEVNRMKDALKRIQSRIVQSPERLKRNITLMHSSTAQDRKMINQQEAKAKDLSAKISALKNIEKDLSNCIEQLKTIERHIGDLHTSGKKLAESRSLLDKNHITQNDLQLRKAHAEKQVTSAQDKLQRAVRHSDEKKIASQRTLERLRHEYEQMARDRQENEKQIDELRSDTNRMATKIGDHLKQSEVELNDLLVTYWRLRNETEVYMGALAEKLNMRVDSD